MCAGHVGGVSRLLVQFVQGIQNYRVWGPPKLEYAPTTLEEEHFAKQMNQKEGNMFECAAITTFNSLKYILEEESDEEPQEQIQELAFDCRLDNCDCSDMPFCCNNLSAMVVGAMDEDIMSVEKVRYLKQLLLAQEGGISVEYRCVK